MIGITLYGIEWSFLRVGVTILQVNNTKGLSLFDDMKGSLLSSSLYVFNTSLIQAKELVVESCI